MSTTLKNWVILDKTSGSSGSTAVKLSAAAYYGREARTAVTLKVDANELSGHTSADTTFTVKQSGYGNYISISSSTFNLKNTGGNVIIQGVCNWKSMYIISVTGDTDYLIDNVADFGLTANTVYQSQGAISGDPGATGMYSYYFDTISVASNEETTSKSIVLKLGNASTATATITINIAAAAPYVTLSPTSITIPAANTVQTLKISSNAGWKITQ
jgi:hypothetical protein